MSITLHTDNETWLTIPEFEGRHEVSNLGRVRSLPRTVMRTGGKILTVKGRVMKPFLNKGYPRYTFTQDGKFVYKFAHQLVMLCFVGPCPEGQEVRHKNDNREDCRLSNLEYGTRSQNIADCKRNGGFRNGASHLTDDIVREIYNRPLTELGRELAAEFKVSIGTISAIRSGKAWLHLGLPERRLIRSGDDHPARRGAKLRSSKPTS